MTQPNFLELRWKASRALELMEANPALRSSAAYRDRLARALEHFDRATRSTDDTYNEWRRQRGVQMKAFRELRRTSDRLRIKADEHALDGYPSEQVVYTEEDHMLGHAERVVAFLSKHENEWDWISDAISEVKQLADQSRDNKKREDAIYKTYTVRVKERVAAYDNLLSTFRNYLSDATSDSRKIDGFGKVTLELA